MQNWVLRTAALAVGLIGLGYLLVPAHVLAIYGVALQSVTETAIVRAAYGGAFVAFAALFALGAQRPAVTRPAVVALATFMGGFALGRLASLAIDGVPHPILVMLLPVEIAYAALALLLLRSSR